MHSHLLWVYTLAVLLSPTRGDDPSILRMRGYVRAWAPFVGIEPVPVYEGPTRTKRACEVDVDYAPFIRCEAKKLKRENISAVALHELIHVKRGDAEHEGSDHGKAFEREVIRARQRALVEMLKR